MQLNRSHNTAPALFSIATRRAEFQIIATGNGLVLDVQARSFDTTGHERTDHATTILALDEAVRLEGLLVEALDAVWNKDDDLTELNDPRQTAIWSNASFTSPTRSRRAA